MVVGRNHFRNDIREANRGSIAEVPQRLFRRKLVGPEVGKRVHVDVQFDAKAKARVVLANLCEQLVRREGKAGNAVAPQRLAELRLVGLLQRDQATH